MTNDDDDVKVVFDSTLLVLPVVLALARMVPSPLGAVVAGVVLPTGTRRAALNEKRPTPGGGILLMNLESDDT